MGMHYHCVFLRVVIGTCYVRDFSFKFLGKILFFLCYFFFHLIILLANCFSTNSYGIVMEKQLGHALIVMDFAQLDIGGHRTMLFTLHLRCVL